MVETISVKRLWNKYDDNTQELPEIVPNVVFKTRGRDESIGGDNPYRWEDKTSFDYFAKKRVVLFSLPGAFTPTCSTYQLPGFEENFKAFKELGIDDILCVSVNDAFVMNCWAKQQKIKKVKIVDENLIPKEFFVLDMVGLRKALIAGLKVPGAELIEELTVIAK